MYTYRPLVIDLAYFRDRKLKKDVYWSIHCNENKTTVSPLNLDIKVKHVHKNILDSFMNTDFLE